MNLSPAGRALHRRAVVTGCLAGVATLCLYAATCAQGIDWQDSGMHQYRIVTGQIENPFGLALTHPLHYYLGRAAVALPFGDPAFKLNLLSSLFGALAVGVVAGLVVRLSGYVLAGIFAAAAMALSNSYWQMSALTETYTLAAALMTVEWVCLLAYVRTRRPIWLVAVFFVNGLHVADHVLGLLTLATYGTLLLERVIRRRMAPIWLPVVLGAWLLGATPYWTLCLSHFRQTGDLAATIRSAVFGGYGGHGGWQDRILSVGLSKAQLKMFALSFGYCFPSLTALVALVGLFRRFRGRRRIFRRVLLAQTAIIFAFIARYNIPDLYTYFVPICALVALWFGLGVATLQRRWRTPVARRLLVSGLTVNALLPLVVYGVFPEIARQRGWARANLRDIPYRDEYTHFFRPWRQGDHSVEEYTQAVLTEIGPGGWFVGGATEAPAVALYCRLHGAPEGVRVFFNARDMLDHSQPAITPQDVRAHVDAGYRVLVVPTLGPDALIPPHVHVDKSGLLWKLLPAGPTSAPTEPSAASSGS